MQVHVRPLRVSRQKSRASLLAAMAAVALFASPAARGAEAAAPDAPPTLKLPELARPARYAVELTLRPDQETFSGVVEIAVEVKRPTSRLWLNGTKLTVDEAALTPEGGQAVAAKATAHGDDFLGLAFERPVPAGRAALRLKYRGVVERKRTQGIFGQEDGGAWYLFTQFEATSARSAFPCFDEPIYKVPWTLTLRVPKELVAVSNTPVVSETAADADGFKVVRFAETKPLPSYLVAFGVGPFEFVEARRAGKNATPVRIVVPKGRQAEAQWAVESTPPILKLLEDYFGIPYPYEKLDSLAIPQTVGFGAMENPGLVTYRQGLILSKPEELSIQQKRGYAGVAAHELAHQWFGDLVTMAWWDDIWLNEAFATWMASKIMETWKPEWGGRISRVGSRSGALAEDELVTARKIRQPIETGDDIANAFDGITYQKGAAALAMFEASMGEEAFRRGVRRYLAAHAFGNATTDQFLAALAAEGGPEVARAFSTFLDQPGAPLVAAELRDGADGKAVLALTQKRLLPLGAPAKEATWRLPVCARWSAKGEPGRGCTWLTAPTGELKLPVAKSAVDWILANDGMAGYFRTIYRGGLLARLLPESGASPLPAAEKVGLVGDVAALVRTGDVPLADALRLVPRLSADEKRQIVEASTRLLGEARPLLRSDESRARFARFIRSAFGDRAKALGFSPKPGEDEDTRLLRALLVGLVARDGQDAALRADARKLALSWLETRKGVDANLLGTVLDTAAEGGDAALFDRYLSEAKKTPSRRERGLLLGALGAFSEPVLQERALGLLLSDDFDPRESFRVGTRMLRSPATHEALFRFTTSKYDALMARLPKEFGENLIGVGAGFCDEARRAEVEAFYKARAAEVPGGPRVLAQTLEEIGNCVAFRKAQDASLKEFLASY